MKAITLWQPWASLVALGPKKVETRSWTTKHRGELAIHSASAMPSRYLGRSRYGKEFGDQLQQVLGCPPHELMSKTMALPRGFVLCIVRLLDVIPVDRCREDLSERERIFGNYDDGRYAWFLEMVHVLKEPVPAKGNRMLWNWHWK
jgi:hypothetical protein